MMVLSHWQFKRFFTLPNHQSRISNLKNKTNYQLQNQDPFFLNLKIERIRKEMLPSQLNYPKKGHIYQL